MLAAVLSRRGAMCLFFWFLKYKGFPQASFLGQEDPLEKEDRGTCWATVHGLQRVRHNWQTEHAHTKYKDSFIDKLTNWRPIHLLRIICFEFSTSDNDFFILQKNRNRIYSCMYVYMLCLIAQPCLTLCDPMDCGPPGTSVLGGSPGQNTGVGSCSFLQEIIPTQGSNTGVPHCRWILYRLSHQGSPWILECLAYPFSRESSWHRNGTQVSCIAGGFFTNWATRHRMFSLENRHWNGSISELQVLDLSLVWLQSQSPGVPVWCNRPK